MIKMKNGNDKKNNQKNDLYAKIVAVSLSTIMLLSVVLGMLYPFFVK